MISESTPTKRRSPNVLIGTFRNQPNFKGRVTEIFGHAVALENGLGGSQWVALRDLEEDPT